MSRGQSIFAALALLLAGVMAAACGAGAPEQELAQVSQDLRATQSRLAALEQEQAVAAQQLTESQKQLAISQDLMGFYQKRTEASLGDRLVLTEGVYSDLPKTISQAETQGYALLDTLDSKGKLLEAACFGHEGILHYGVVKPKVTAGSQWHGAPIILMYDAVSGGLHGLVLESTSPQPAPPWEHHTGGHPGMSFEHWSMHVWFTTPAHNLSLAEHK